jgi:cephalosporin hydroxylase
MFWDTYCLIEVCVAWGGRSITLAQKVIEHGSPTVGFELLIKKNSFLYH